MGCWGDGLCASDADLDMLALVEDACGIKIVSNGVDEHGNEMDSEEEDSLIKANLTEYLDDLVEDYSDEMTQLKKSAKHEYMSLGYNMMLLIHTAIENKVEISDNVRAIGLKHLVVLSGHKRKQMKKNLEIYRPGEAMPARSNGLFETAAYDAAAESTTSKAEASAADDSAAGAAQPTDTARVGESTKAEPED